MADTKVIINCGLFAKEIEQCGVKHYKLYANYSFFSFWLGKFLRKFHINKFSNINPELDTLKADGIIVFDSGISDTFILERLAKKYAEKKLIFYYWNPVFTSINPNKIPLKFEKWSYSPTDCEEYGMKYNSTFYFKSFVKEPSQIKRDVFFIGKDKGRKRKLDKIKKIFDLEGVSSTFYLTSNHPRFSGKKYRKAISYDKVLDYVNESKAVLDYYVNPHAGLSLRAMEALFLGKKLISNNKNVVNYDFYNEENVYQLDFFKNKSLKDFLASSMVHINSQIRDRYLFCNWINRFI